MIEILVLCGVALFSYLLGSIPFGLVLVKAAGLGDIRTVGSGNVGATNVLRTGRKGLALATLLLDSGKGAIAAALAWWGVDLIAPTLVSPFYGYPLYEVAALTAGTAAVLGHNFPVWLNFKGGKGVATTLGVLLVTAWPVGLLSLLTWLGVALVFRYSSLAALVALVLAPVYACVFGLATPLHALVFAGLAVLALVMHRENIRRLINGTESKIGSKGKRSRMAEKG